MKFYTPKELLGTWGTPLHEEKDISQYAEELSDGWRFWTTIGTFAFPILVIYCFTTELTDNIIIAILLVVLVPILTTVGYILGALKKHFSPWAFLRLAIKHFRK